MVTGLDFIVSSRQFHIFTLALSTTDSDIDKSRYQSTHPAYTSFCRMSLGFDRDIDSASHFAPPHLVPKIFQSRQSVSQSDPPTRKRLASFIHPLNNCSLARISQAHRTYLCARVRTLPFMQPTDAKDSSKCTMADINMEDVVMSSSAMPDDDVSDTSSPSIYEASASASNIPLEETIKDTNTKLRKFLERHAKSNVKIIKALRAKVKTPDIDIAARDHAVGLVEEYQKLTNVICHEERELKMQPRLQNHTAYTQVSLHTQGHVGTKLKTIRPSSFALRSQRQALSSVSVQTQTRVAIAR